MRYRAALLAVLVLLSGCVGVPSLGDVTGGSQPDVQAPDDVSAAVEPAPADLADPTSDRLGWEGGYWYNESVSVTRADGLNDTELDAVVNRTMARVEAIRGLEFEEPVPVTVVQRSEFQRSQSGRETPASVRQFDNAKFEALFMVNESAESIGVQRTNSGVSVGGYYSPSEDEIVVISESETPTVDTSTLAHELVHGLQDQHFDLASLSGETRREHNAIDGLVEGDANLVQYAFDRRCEGEWTCLGPEAESGESGGENGTVGNESTADTESESDSGSSGLAAMGPYLLKYQPYSDGPAFVYRLYERGGWATVNDAYANPPTSSEQIIHPARYPDDRPAELEVPDRSVDGWERVEPDGRVDYGSVGEAGIAAMFAAPLYEKPGARLVDPDRWLNQDADGNVSDFDPLNYDLPPSNGYEGDRFVAYTNAANESAYVWKLRFENESEATEFVDGYESMLDYRNATTVDDAAGPGTVYRIPEADPNGFADAFRVVERGDTVVVVNAPEVGELDRVHRVEGGA
ncbi:Hvo_1808 family surface protein [Halobium salinum]|uniref:Hvo_1808 family surface protein n=1 Tax=Halobium salinum TaxID=1364940 RepID=A0ABD5PB32_9EURY|nr:Hvo_1808 family surface protein [Halobium salinum]